MIHRYTRVVDGVKTEVLLMERDDGTLVEIEMYINPETNLGTWWVV